MKTPSLFLTIATTLCGLTLAQGQVHQHEESHTSSSSSHSSESRTVTTTSDGNRTVTKTVIVRDGVKEVITEITDANGKTTTTRTGGAGGGGEARAGGEARGGGGTWGEEGDEGDMEEGGAWLGIRVKEISPAIRSQLGLPEDQGVEIDAVASEGPAAKAGIEVGDLLLSFEETPIGTPEDLATLLRDLDPGTVVELEIMRKGETKTVEVMLEERPADQDDPPAPPEDEGENGGDGPGIKIEIEGGEFDQILDDPNIPEEFKRNVREMQRQMEEFRKKHMP